MDDRRSFVFTAAMVATLNDSGALPRRLGGIAAVFALLILLPMIGCRPKPPVANGALKASVQFEPNPPSTGAPVKLHITMTDSQGKPLAIDNLEVEGDMNHAGMSPVFAHLTATAPGEFSGQIQFTMGGDWFLLLTGQLTGNTHFLKKIDVPGVKAQ